MRIHQLSTWLLFSVLVTHRTHREWEEGGALPSHSSGTQVTLSSGDLKIGIQYKAVVEFASK